MKEVVVGDYGEAEHLEEDKRDSSWDELEMRRLLALWGCLAEVLEKEKDLG